MIEHTYVFWAGSELCRSCTTSLTPRLGSRLSRSWSVWRVELMHTTCRSGTSWHRYKNSTYCTAFPPRLPSTADTKRVDNSLSTFKRCTSTTSQACGCTWSLPTSAWILWALQKKVARILRNARFKCYINLWSVQRKLELQVLTGDLQYCTPTVLYCVPYWSMYISYYDYVCHPTRWAMSFNADHS